MNTQLLNINVSWVWAVSDVGRIHQLLVFVDGEPFEHGYALVLLDTRRLAALDDDERDEGLTPGWCLRVVTGDYLFSRRPGAPQWRRSPARSLTYLFCNPFNWWPYEKSAALGQQPLRALIQREFETRFAQLSRSSTSRTESDAMQLTGSIEPLSTPSADLKRLDAELACKRAELADLQRECEQLREQRRQLIRSLEGQLDLFRDQVAQSEQLLNEVRHG